jgi:PST family polysaccharide transporter
MIGQMLGDERLGVYSAAVRLTEVWYFIPVAITSSVFPAIVSAKKTGEAKYYDSLEQLYLLMVWLALGVAIPITVFAEPIVELVFGPEYRDGATVLAIQCWSGLFIFAGLVSNHWYLLENLSHYTLYRHLLGAGMNIAINLVLIPRYGIDGAAIATLITQFITSYMFDLLNRPTKILFRIKSRYFFLFLPITIRHLMGATAGGKGR